MVSILDSLRFNGNRTPEAEMDAVAALIPQLCADPRRLLVISDVHGNWPALRAVLEHAAGSYDAIWCLGDLVGYGPFPAHCIMFLLRFVCQACWCAGNHDMGLLRLLKKTDFFFSKDAWDVLNTQRMVLQDEHLDLWNEFERQVKRQQPRTPAVCAFGHGHQVFVHDNLESDWEYLVPSNIFKTRDNVIKLRDHQPRPDASVCLLAGHSHIPCLFQINGASEDPLHVQAHSIFWGQRVSIGRGRYYINPGSVGQPRDRDPRAAYVILDTEALTATWHRVEYDRYLVIKEMYEKKYPKVLWTMLEEGGTAQTFEKLRPWYRSAQGGLEAVDMQQVEQ